MEKVVRTPKAASIVAAHTRRRKPVGALPAIALSPDRAQAIELVVHRARLGRARGGALLIGEMDRKDTAVGFFVLLHDVALARVLAKAARIHGQHVDSRFAGNNPFGELPAGAACGCDAKTV